MLLLLNNYLIFAIIYWRVPSEPKQKQRKFATLHSTFENDVFKARFRGGTRIL